MTVVIFSIISLSVPLVMLIIGINLVRSSKGIKDRSVKKYSCMVYARVVGSQKYAEFESNWGEQHRTEIYVPVYEYFYNAKYYNAVSKVPVINNKLQIGSYKKIYINPDNPNDIYEVSSNKAGTKLKLIGGISLILCSIMSILTSIFMIFASTNFSSISSTIENMINNMDQDKFSEIVWNVVMFFVMGKMLGYVLAVVACIAVVGIVNGYIKKRKARCINKIHLAISDGNANISNRVTYTANGQLYTKNIPYFLRMLILKINPAEQYIYINPKKPQETYHPIISKVVLAAFGVVAGLIALIPISQIIDMLQNF